VLFPTVQFAVFFVVVLTANWLLMHNRTWWKVGMLAASYVFYGAWDWRFVFLIVLSTAGNQVAVAAMSGPVDDRRRKRIVVAAVVGNLGVLAWFKYYGFFVSSLINLFAAIGVDLPLPLLQITLPVGISFFTFQALSYVLDVYWRRQDPASPIDFAVYLAFFPQLVAGPIVRATEFLPQLRRPRDPRRVPAAEAFLLIAGGLFKKVVVATLLGTEIVDPVFANPGAHSALEVLVGIYAYAVQIYSDFSGYTDIAIGVALLMGFRFPQNFDRPYAAVSLQEFWRRWHMTLSRWLRDYLYIPLGGSRGSEAATYRNLMLTMVLGGLWHGAAWTFVVWGTLHGGWLALERWHRRRGPEPGPPANPWLGRLVTFHVVCLGWVFFRADSFDTAWQVLGRLADWGAAPLVTPTVLALVIGGIGVQYIPTRTRLRIRAGFGRLGVAGMATALTLFLVVLDAVGPEGVAPFIYFQF